MSDQEEAPTETMEEMERRHKKELRELEGKVRGMLKGAKKAQKAELEAKAIQLEYDMKAKHREEEEKLEELIEKLGATVFTTSSSSSTGSEEAAAAAAAEAAAAAAEAEAARIAKAQKKKAKSAAKDVEREARKAEIASSAGPSQRLLELETINATLAKEQLCVKEIVSDGNCLYRAVADQLAFVRAAEQPSFEELRRRAAAYMGAHPEDFAAFVECEAGSQEFRDYVAGVARSSGDSVEWGGQVEIMAMCAVLQRTMVVVAANAPPVVMGQEFQAEGGPELRLAYHKHYFSLGEHYNSVEKKPA